MSKRIIIVVVVAVAVLATGMVVDTASGGNIPINWRISGTLIYGPLFSTSTFDSPVGVIIDGVAKGAPGSAVLKVVAIPGAMVDPNPTTPHCGVFPEIPYVSNDVVVIFEDQSMLFATLDEGYVCLGPVDAVFEVTIVGGTGKYTPSTSGYWKGTFKAIPFNNSGIIFAETGTIGPGNLPVIVFKPKGNWCETRTRSHRLRSS